MGTEKNTKRIGFIGGGNMATAIISGLISTHYPTECIFVADPDPQTRDRLANTFHLTTSADNQSLAAQVDVLVLCVKPQQLRDVVHELAPLVKQRDPLIISIAVGIPEKQISQWLGCTPPIVRVMPNTPALIKKGASGLFANVRVTEAQKNYAETLLRSVGSAVWVTDESLLEVIAALSGSGPAYYFLFLEYMVDAAVNLGLPHEMATLLAIETAEGAASMALISDEPLSLLRERVTSKGGTTERAIAVFEKYKLRSAVHEALQAAVERSAELAKTLS